MNEEERESGWEEEQRHNRTLGAILGVIMALFVVVVMIYVIVGELT